MHLSLDGIAESFFGNLLYGIAVICAPLIVGFIVGLKLRSKESARRKIVLEKMLSAGLWDFHKNIHQSNEAWGIVTGGLVSTLSRAQTRAIIITWGLSADQASHSGIAKEIAGILHQDGKGSLAITILIPSMDNDCIKLMAEHVGISPKTFSTQLQDLRDSLLAAKNSLGVDAKKRFTIMEYDSLPYFSAIVIDPDTEKEWMQLEIKPRKATTGRQFLLELSRPEQTKKSNKTEDGLFNICWEACKDQLSTAQEIWP
jgi:hypothetical protein